MILIIIGIACLSFIITSIFTPHLPQWLKTKPFTCESCMAFWLTLIYLGLTIESIIFASISYIIAGLIWKL